MGKLKTAQKMPYVLDTKPGIYYYCTCGKSSNQPFCDGSHKDSIFIPEKVEIKEEKKIAWCGCKHSSNGAFCDGTHNKL
ncbi:MAG: CDGSH iron-sulfur domain-containing protein [Chlorobi bacterium]|nr:CDGSH iron-sulfur domain-containing protein [Chlorobiota bacterium]